MIFYAQYRCLILIFLTTILVELIKLICGSIKERKFNCKKMIETGEIPSLRVTLIVLAATMIGKDLGIASPVFALTLVISIIMIYNIAREIIIKEKNEKLLNKILENPKLENNKFIKGLVKALKCVQVQILFGIIIGLIIGIIF